MLVVVHACRVAVIVTTVIPSLCKRGPRAWLNICQVHPWFGPAVMSSGVTIGLIDQGESIPQGARLFKRQWSDPGPLLGNCVKWDFCEPTCVSYSRSVCSVGLSRPMYGLNVHGMRIPPLSVPVLARFPYYRCITPFLTIDQLIDVPRKSVVRMLSPL